MPLTSFQKNKFNYSKLAKIFMKRVVTYGIYGNVQGCNEQTLFKYFDFCSELQNLCSKQNSYMLLT